MTNAFDTQLSASAWPLKRESVCAASAGQRRLTLLCVLGAARRATKAAMIRESEEQKVIEDGRERYL
jgi:hypothetical protein